MGLFSRDRKSAAENSPEAEIIADEHMVARVATLMNDFNAAVGSDSQMRATASAIASAAGLHDLKQAVTQPSMLDRPWRMLAAVATRSAQDGNFALAAQVFGFVEYWNAQIKASARTRGLVRTSPGRDTRRYSRGDRRGRPQRLASAAARPCRLQQPDRNDSRQNACPSRGGERE
jgi:hypothetical protein